MPDGRRPARSHVWPSGGAHFWPSGGTSAVSSHPRGHLVCAARGVLSVHTGQGTSIVPANRVAWTPADTTHHHRAHGDTDMRIVFLPPSLARLVPDHPAVFAASDHARSALLTLTGPRNDDPSARPLDPAARARLRRFLVDEFHEAPEQTAPAAPATPQPRDDRLRALAFILLSEGHDTTHVAHACGWANPSHFIAAFTNLVGTTPGRHRAGQQGQASPGG
ncbi:AraC family transcriptional regulator [Amycolatopsis sp. NPDC023774]|uniref:AraC family transcriptional regulator n=1 Tax=Amycolatopsis sp. NPDC023774 TaxID=3155015 RepID=UPI0033FDD5F7